MALKYALDGNILHVTETTFTATRDIVRHWYYDIAAWMKSSNGREGDTPNRNMTSGDIEWVRKHYFPKVGL